MATGLDERQKQVKLKDLEKRLTKALQDRDMRCVAIGAQSHLLVPVVGPSEGATGPRHDVRRGSRGAYWYR